MPKDLDRYNSEIKSVILGSKGSCQKLLRMVNKPLKVLKLACTRPEVAEIFTYTP